MKRIQNHFMLGVFLLGLIFSMAFWANKTQAQTTGTTSSQMCPTVWDPVCGIDGVTYGNDCEAKGAGVGIEYWGECHPKGGDEQCLKDITLSAENSRRDHQNRDREMRDLSRSKVDVSSVKALLDQWKQVINALDGYVQKNDCNGFWDYQGDKEQDARWQVDDAFSKMYSAQQVDECKKQVAEKKRMLERDKVRMIDEGKRQGHDMSKLESILEQLKQMLGQLEQFVSGPNFDVQECWTKQQDFQWLEQDFWDENQRINEKSIGKEQIRMVKEKRQFLRDKERTIKEHQREKRDVSQLEALLRQMIMVIEKMEAMISGGDQFDHQALQDLDMEYNDLDRQFWDMNQELWQEQQDQQIFRIIKEKQQQVKQMTRECERSSCEGEAKLVIEKIQSLLGEMEKAAQAKDFPEAWDLNQDIDDISGDFWNSFQKVNEKQDLKRWLKDVEREVMKDMPRWLKDVCQKASPLCERASGYLNEMQEIYQKAKQTFEAGDYQEARDFLQYEGQEARDKFHEAMQQMQDKSHGTICFDELGGMNSMLDMATEIMNNLINQGEVDAQAGQLCLSYIDRGRSLMGKLKNSCEQVDDSQEEFWQEMDQLGQLVSQDCPELMQQMEGIEPPSPGRSPHGPGPQFGPDIEQFTEQYFEEEDFQGIANKMFEKVLPEVMRQVMDQLANNAFLFEDIITNLTEQLAGRFEEHLANAVEALTFIPEEFQNEFLSEKRELMEQVAELENTIAALEAKRISLEQEINAFQEKLAKVNLIGDAADDMQEAVAAFIARAPRLGKAEVKAQLEDLEDQFEEAEEESRFEKFERGMVPFADTDDHEWFTLYAAQAKEEGFVKGTGESGGTEFNPAGLTNLAETCIMFGRVEGVDLTGIPTSAVGKRVPEWARPGCKALENANVDLDGIFGAKKAGDAVTRGEVVLLLNSLFDLPEGGRVRFTDLQSATPEEQEAVRAVVQAGIANGYDDGSGRFGFDDPLNRAGLAKFIIKALELQGQ